VTGRAFEPPRTTAPYLRHRDSIVVQRVPRVVRGQSCASLKHSSWSLLCHGTESDCHGYFKQSTRLCSGDIASDFYTIHDCFLKLCPAYRWPKCWIIDSRSVIVWSWPVGTILRRRSCTCYRVSKAAPVPDIMSVENVSKENAIVYIVHSMCRLCPMSSTKPVT
jgi:hypothetical protein